MDLPNVSIQTGLVCYLNGVAGPSLVWLFCICLIVNPLGPLFSLGISAARKIVIKKLNHQKKVFSLKLFWILKHLKIGTMEALFGWTWRITCRREYDTAAIGGFILLDYIVTSTGGRKFCTSKLAHSPKQPFEPSRKPLLTRVGLDWVHAQATAGEGRNLLKWL